jgi:hypothetical protein
MNLVNPLAAFSDTYNVLEGMAQDRAKRQAGNALAQGDYGAASGALLGRGMLDAGMGVQRYQRDEQDRMATQQRQLSEQEKAAAGERVQFLMRAAQTLRGLPAEQRGQMLQSQILPAMGNFPGFDPEMLAQIAQSDLSDQTLDVFSQALGAEADKYQLFNLGNGGIAAVNPRTQDVRTLREPTVDPLEQDYMRARIAATEAQVPLREAQAVRAARPPAARGGRGATGGTYSDVPAGARVVR